MRGRERCALLTGWTPRAGSPSQSKGSSHNPSTRPHREVVDVLAVVERAGGDKEG